ncbi:MULTISPECIES: AAA family ATPase [Roseomonadaceae]|uniref:AAA+ ATPase domain-containing protein n=1 Tax=Falsiroseomonas oleicola TaxID=2801474 RepID=A0ABS6H7Z1_9PROT|nr:hypothetical protein [Roseomonas oleicola]MBU8544816.1 hypothetical protein [Roseomonas oleicola]
MLLETTYGRGYRLLGDWAASAEGANAAASPAAPLTNLPLPISRLVAREEALGQVVRLLAGHRLVTLTGSPGIGKTCLAIEAARHYAQEAGLAAFLVDLTTVAEPRQVPGALAEVLLPGGEPRVWQAKQLAEALTNRTLLLLDGCEHVVAETARLVHLIVTRCAGIRVLMTGRDTLRIDGEQVWRLPALEPRPARSR